MANNRFLNRFSQRMVRPDQFIFVAFPTQLQALKLGVAYKDSEERVQYTIVEWPREANNPSWNRSRNLSPLVVAIRLSEVIEETISVDNLLYYEASLYLQDGTLADRIRFNMDFKHYKQLTHLVFYNLFGMPETLYFTGMDESTSEIEGTYALMAGQYSKIKTEMHDVHVINSGYINASTLDSIKDMICSKEVYLYHGTTRQAITILDAELVTTKPRNAPTNVRITYRLADEKSTVFGRPDLDNTNVFDDIFDYTFN